VLSLLLLLSGYEPRGLFNVVEFVMNDKTGTGCISLEEALQIMYLRHGRAELDAKLEEVFGTADLNSGKTLSLTEFLACLHQNQVKQLLNRVTAKNYRPGATGAQQGGASPCSTVQGQ
jgi:calmodulin